MNAAMPDPHIYAREHPGLDVAILVPVYQNAATVESLASRVARALVAIRPAYQIVFVVDASPDNSWHIIRQLAKDERRICGILLRANIGQHAALMEGLQQVSARCIVVMDADLQDPPEVLPKLIDQCIRTNRTVFARRDGQYQRWDRMLTSRIFKYLLAKLIDMPADAGSYFAVPEAVAMRMRGAEVATVQLVVMASMLSSGWSGVHYFRRVRDEGVSAYSSWGRLHSAMNAFVCAWQCRRWLRSKSFTSPKPRCEINSSIIERVNI